MHKEPSVPDIITSYSDGLFYRKMGAGPVIILIHGFPENGTLWRNIWDDLAASFTLIIPDLPGSGDSELEGPTGITDMAKGIKRIMDDEQIEKAIIAGHSMGGYIAFAFARLYPDSVAGLSLVHSTPAADDEEKKTMRRKAIELIKNGGKKPFINQMVTNLFAPSFKQTNPEAIQQQIDEAMKLSDDGLINFYNAMLTRDDNRDLLAGAYFPIQWIMGFDDNVIPYKKILTFYLESGLNFVSIYCDCGHMSMVEVPRNLITDLSAFGKYCYDKP